MKTQFKSLWLKVLIIASCLVLVGTTAVMANSDDGNTRELKNDDISTMELIKIDEGNGASGERGIAPDYHGYEREELMIKHREIDSYVFFERNGDFTDIGFKVMNTGPIDGVIEIGILPYEKAFADHLYELFGTEDVRVVEGFQAVTLDLPVSTTDEPVSDISEVAVSDDGSEPATRIAVERTGDAVVGDEEVEVVADIAMETLMVSDTGTQSNSNAMIITLTIASFMLIGISYFSIVKFKPMKN